MRRILMLLFGLVAIAACGEIMPIVNQPPAYPQFARTRRSHPAVQQSAIRKSPR